jgi:hypothetical protein
MAARRSEGAIVAIASGEPSSSRFPGEWSFRRAERRLAMVTATEKVHRASSPALGAHAVSETPSGSARFEPAAADECQTVAV